MWRAMVPFIVDRPGRRAHAGGRDLPRVSGTAPSGVPGRQLVRLPAPPAHADPAGDRTVRRVTGLRPPLDRAAEAGPVRLGHRLPGEDPVDRGAEQFAGDRLAVARRGL